jgi:ATP-dependent helicase/nuclease subunit A
MQEQVIVVEACAGSGKTYALAKRYLQLLLTDSENDGGLRSILAITFTNKASVEMKERILELIKRVAFDDFTSQAQRQDILAALNMPLDKLRARAVHAMEVILANYSFFQVQTIDSFINAILLGCSANIDRSASFKIRRDAKQFLEYCLDLAIDRARDDGAVRAMFEEFLEHYLFVERREGWFPKKDILTIMRGLFTVSNNYGVIFQPHALQSRDVIKSKRELLEEIKKISSLSPEGLNLTTKKSLEKFADNNDPFFSTKTLPSKLAQDIVPMNKGFVADNIFMQAWFGAHTNARKLVEMESAVACDPYVLLFSVIFDVFKDISRQEDVIFLEELNRKARLVFDAQGITVAEVYYRLAGRFRHYLIDEFQDTSRLQWRNLQMMIEEALACGGDLFYVGDKKQAIYRFRGGDAGLFDSVRENLSQYPQRIDYLNKNWRSCSEIVHFNNEVFSQENIYKFLNMPDLLENDLLTPQANQAIAAIFKNSRQDVRENSQGGYINITRFEESGIAHRDILAKDRFLEIIDDVSKRFLLGDIAVLCRGNDEVEKVSGWLIENGINVESEKTLNVLEHALVREIIALLKFFHSPIDDLNFCTFIMGEIFSEAVKIDQKEMRDFIFSLHTKGEMNKGTPLYILFRVHYKDIWDQHLSEFFKSVGFISPYELLISLYSRFMVMENFASSQGLFAKFLELVKFKEEDCVGLAQILDYFESPAREDLYVNPGRSDAVKVLTIHKSKGLEFETVILPFLRIDISAGNTAEVEAHIEDIDAQALKLVRINAVARKFSPTLKDIYARDYSYALIDELNNLYVALTRARSELYVMIPRKSANSNNMAKYLIPENIIERGVKTTSPAATKAEIDIIKPQTFYCEPWPDVFKHEFGEPSSIVMRAQTLNGTILHYMLSFIGHADSDDYATSLKMAATSAAAKFHIRDITTYYAHVEAIVHCKDFCDIFFPLSGSAIHCEKELANDRGDLKLVDRLVITPREIIVVDYKSSVRDDEAYRAQVREYMQIVRSIYGAKKIKGYLLYLDTLTRDEVSIT